MNHTTTSQPLVSIIVPVFNVEDYLVLTINSLRRQTLSSIEILCVDDGSYDQSPNLLAMLASLDDRIKIITKHNGGLSSARNAGLEMATGRYLCFLDADDLFVPEACETIAAAFMATDADILVFGAKTYPELRSEPWLEQALSPRNGIYEGFDPAVLFEEASTPFVWRTALTKEFYDRTRLTFNQRIPFGEDIVFQFNAYPRASRIALIADKLVQYRIYRPGSLMNRHIVDHVFRLHEHIEIVETVLRDWRDLGLLECYNEELLSWVLDFIGFDIAEAEGDARSELGLHARRTFAPYFSQQTWINALDDPRYTTAVIALWNDDPVKASQSTKAADENSSEGIGARPFRLFEQFNALRDRLFGPPDVPEDNYDPLQERLNAWDLNEMKERIAAVRALEREVDTHSSDHQIP